MSSENGNTPQPKEVTLGGTASMGFNAKAQDPQPEMPTMRMVSLTDSGLLWLINREVFHPRGYALGITMDDEGRPQAAVIMGDGTEPVSFSQDVDEKAIFAALKELLP